eukprot:9430352-Pyramimonas_sp.AAC.1
MGLKRNPLTVAPHSDSCPVGPVRVRHPPRRTNQSQTPAPSDQSESDARLDGPIRRRCWSSSRRSGPPARTWR